MANWKEYQIYDINTLIKTLPEDEEYDTKVLFENKKLFGNDEDKKIKMFSKKDFQDYSSNHDAYVIGRISKKQKTYKKYYECVDYWDNDKESLQKHIGKKVDDKFKGMAWFDVPVDKTSDNQKEFEQAFDNKHKDKFQKFYDVGKTKDAGICGYAYIGNDQFLEVSKKFLPIWIWWLISLLLVIGICVGLLFSKNGNKLPFVTNEGTEITDNSNQPVAVESLPNVDYLLFPETVTLTAENPYIKLCNLASNEGLWYISYQVYIDGEPLMDLNNPDKVYDTGAIKPGFMVDGSNDPNLDLYNRLDAGTYELIAKATQYKYEPNENDEHLRTSVGQKIQTTLIIQK
ncbi:MAG: hypothetical protein ACI37Z_05140 [Candidatus Gastranaerophilaceae bacterium]